MLQLVRRVQPPHHLHVSRGPQRRQAAVPRGALRLRAFPEQQPRLPHHPTLVCLYVEHSLALLPRSSRRRRHARVLGCSVGHHMPRNAAAAVLPRTFHVVRSQRTVRTALLVAVHPSGTAARVGQAIAPRDPRPSLSARCARRGLRIPERIRRTRVRFRSHAIHLDFAYSERSSVGGLLVGH
eukprot:2705563-Rhodomonas_salina.2